MLTGGVSAAAAAGRGRGCCKERGRARPVEVSANLFPSLCLPDPDLFLYIWTVLPYLCTCGLYR